MKTLLENLEHIKFLLEECGEHVTPRPFVDECIAIARQDAENWQPIETAPLDTRILLWWRPVDNNPYAETVVCGQISSHEKGKWWNDRAQYDDIFHVKYWMPLPCHPKKNEINQNNTLMGVVIDRSKSAVIPDTLETDAPTNARNRINKIISGCMTRGMSSEATTDEVWEYLHLNFSPILKRLEFVEDKQIGIWQRGDNSGYQTWNDGEYEISKATKELRAMLCKN